MLLSVYSKLDCMVIKVVTNSIVSKPCFFLTWDKMDGCHLDWNQGKFIIEVPIYTSIIQNSGQ